MNEEDLENRMNELNSGAREVVLRLSNKVDNSRVAELWRALRTSRTESVNLYAHREHSQIAILCQSLAVNCSLRVLDVENVGLEDEGTRLLAKALETNSSLASLNLCGNQIRRTGARHLASALKINTSLRELNLRDNALGNAGAEELAGGLAVNRHLTVLNLCNNEITNQGAAVLAHAVRQTYSIKSINLTKQYVSRKVMADLKTDIAHVQSLLAVLSAGNGVVSRIGTSSPCRLFPSELARTLYAMLNLHHPPTPPAAAAAAAQ